MGKLILFAMMAYIVYYLFFRKKINTEKNNKNEITMVECNRCSVFINQDDAIYDDGKYFCSKNCKNRN